MSVAVVADVVRSQTLVAALPVGAEGLVLVQEGLQPSDYYYYYYYYLAMLSKISFSKMVAYNPRLPL